MGKGQVRAEDLHRVLDAEIHKLRSGADWSKVLGVAALFPTYGFGNIVLINLQMPQASWIARADVWHRLGRSVKAGQAIRILTPVRSRAASAGARGPAGVPGADAQVEQNVIGFKVGSVYDVTATAAPPIYLPRSPMPADAVVARTLWDGLAKAAAADGFAVDVRPLSDGAEGFTDCDSRGIVVADHLDDFRAVARLAHEVAHARMHSLEQGGGALCEGLLEVEAESVAYVVLARYGIALETESLSYISGWAKVVDPAEPAQVIKSTGVRVLDTARQLIESTDEYLKARGALLGRVPARSLDSAVAQSDVDGPVL